MYAYKPHIEELERIHQAVQEGMIFENRQVHKNHSKINSNTQEPYGVSYRSLGLTIPLENDASYGKKISTETLIEAILKIYVKAAVYQSQTNSKQNREFSYYK